MHPDRKIGIAMGILLVGVVAALFFRNEPLHVDEGLSTRRENELNQRLRDRDVTIELNDERGDRPSVSDEPDWSLSELLVDLRAKDDLVPTPIGSHGPPQQMPEHVADSELATVDAANDPGGRQNDGEFRTENVAQAPPVEFVEYTVRLGDTLSEISERFLGAQSRYREIYEANKDRMASPDHLKVGKAIRIPRIMR